MLERRDSEITDVKRRIANQIMIGKIIEVDHQKARYRVKSGAIESDWLADTQARSGGTKTWEGRDIGEQIVLVSPSGDLSQGIIIGSIHTDATQAGNRGNLHCTIYPDGTTVEYDDETNTYALAIREGGKFSLAIEEGASICAEGGKLVFKAPQGFEFHCNNDLSIKAGGGVNIDAAKGMQTHSPQFTHNGKDIGATHRHTDSARGSQLTGAPL